MKSATKDSKEIKKAKQKLGKGKIQLIDASAVCHKLRKPAGNKRNEFTPEDRVIIAKMYSDFVSTEKVQIYDNTEFLYREYAVMQPLQRSYSITKQSIEAMLQKGALSSLYDESKVLELEEKGVAITGKEQKKLEKYYQNKPLFESIIKTLSFSS